MPCLTVAYTRKPFSSGFKTTVASSLSLTPLPLASASRCRAAATTWCRRQCRCPTCGFSELRRKPARRQRAPISSALPSLRLFVFCCRLFFFCSRSHQALGSTRKLRNICQKTPQKHQKKKKKKKSVNYINYYLFYYIAQNKHVKTTAREPQFEDLERDFSLRAQFSLICAFYSPFLPA
jgi:hypothetical protein